LNSRSLARHPPIELVADRDLAEAVCVFSLGRMLLNAHEFVYLD